jgi:predicted amidophosphoribosyltransferase
MESEHPRIRRERKTIRVMISIYCMDFHGNGQGLCPECQALYDYAMQRLDRCVYHEEKPTCLKCPVHCYKKESREQVRLVMRYAGPKMLFRHPVLAIRHLIDGKRKVPPLPKRATQA